MFSVFAFLDTTPATVYYNNINSRGINFIRNGKAYYADSRDKTLFYSIHRLNHFPINFKITKYDWRIYAKNRKENVKPQT